MGYLRKQANDRKEEHKEGLIKVGADGPAAKL